MQIQDIPPLQSSSPQKLLSTTEQKPDLPDDGWDTDRNALLNKQLSERIERDVQRKKHRSLVVGGIIVLCIVFYAMFTVLVFECFRNPETLKTISTAWIMPMMALVAVPTALFIILIFCVYRQRPTIPAAVLRMLNKISTEE